MSRIRAVLQAIILSSASRMSIQELVPHDVRDFAEPDEDDMCLDGRCEHNVAPPPAGTGDDAAGAGGLDRRRLLMAAATGAALTLAPVSFAQGRAAAGTPKGAPGGDEVTRTVTGHLETGAADFVYLPVEVPKGVRK